jgi:hypothetical protein
VHLNRDARVAFSSQRAAWHEMIRMIEDQNKDDTVSAEHQITSFFLSKALEITMM